MDAAARAAARHTDSAAAACEAPALPVLIVGGLRVRYGSRARLLPARPRFWAKLGVFAAIGLVSLLPTLRLLGWRRQPRVQPGFVPPPAQAATLYRFVSAELALLGLVLVPAVTMARYGLFNWYDQYLDVDPSRN